MQAYCTPDTFRFVCLPPGSRPAGLEAALPGTVPNASPRQLCLLGIVLLAAQPSTCLSFGLLKVICCKENGRKQVRGSLFHPCEWCFQEAISKSKACSVIGSSVPRLAQLLLHCGDNWRKQMQRGLFWKQCLLEYMGGTMLPCQHGPVMFSRAQLSQQPPTPSTD